MTQTTLLPWGQAAYPQGMDWELLAGTGTPIFPIKSRKPLLSSGREFSIHQLMGEGVAGDLDIVAQVQLV